MLLVAFLLLWVAVAAAGMVAYGVRPQAPGTPWPRWVFPGIVVSVLALAIGIPAFAVLYDRGPAEHDSRSGLVLDDSEVHGREIFDSVCKKCHTLADARANGTIGPNLDVLRPDFALVIDAVTHGRARGRGQMPSGLVDEQGARDVARYLTTVTSAAAEAKTNHN